MRTLKTGEAAAFLNVSPNTLRTWEQRFGYPLPQRSPGSHRLYAYAEIAALRDALGQGLSVSSAVSVARESLRVDVSGLVHAIAWLRAPRAEEIMSASLALGSVEDAIERLLFPALRELLERKGPRSGPFAFGVSWANDWLRRAERFVAGDEPRTRVLIGDASEPLMSLDGPHLRALEFFCARAGANVVSLPVRAAGGIDDIQAALRPQAIVITGRGASDEDVSGWTFEARSRSGRIPLVLYRRPADRSATMADAVWLKTDSPSEAQHQIFALIRAGGIAGVPVERHRFALPSALSGKTSTETGDFGAQRIGGVAVDYVESHGSSSAQGGRPIQNRTTKGASPLDRASPRRPAAMEPD